MSKIRFLYLILILIFLAACTGGTGANEEPDYEKTKKMIVDILKTDDGKKAIKDVLSDPKMQQSMAIESDVVSKAVSETLLSKKGKDFWNKLFSDPKFVKEFGTVIKDEQKKLTKALMKDPEYQKLLIDIYKNPEMMQQMVTVMKSQKFSSHLEQKIKETLNSPVFQAKISETLLKAAEEKKKSEEGSSGGQSGGGGEQSGGGQGGS